MDYTCENCRNRDNWECDDERYRKKCEYFRLDESTLNEEEQKILEMIRQVMREMIGNLKVQF